ncbi:protein kinase c inhibitor-like protein, putative, partial [Plasmodium reichenowi]
MGFKIVFIYLIFVCLMKIIPGFFTNKLTNSFYSTFVKLSYKNKFMT